ncbi:MAG: MarR family transcriptional regulator [Clostridia bacterium]|nr:MarR family transcriptional regulator [Clostridia bacterium]
MSVDFVLYSLNRAKKLMHHYVDQLLKQDGFEDLVSSYADILTSLHFNEGQLKMHQISDLVGKDKSTVTVLVNRLIDRDYILKEKSQLDKRVTYIKLTEKGKSIQKDFIAMANQVETIAFTDFTNDEINSFKSYMNRLQTNFEEVMKE